MNHDGHMVEWLIPLHRRPVQIDQFAEFALCASQVARARQITSIAQDIRDLAVAIGGTIGENDIILIAADLANRENERTPVLGHRPAFVILENR